MTDEPSGLSPSRFGAAFKSFMEAVSAEAEPSPFLARLRAHLGSDPSIVPVIGEEFDAFEQPNVQVALEHCFARPERSVEVMGVAADNKRFMAITLSDLLSRSGLGRPLSEGPVEYVNFHLAGGEVLACVQFGLYLVRHAESRLAVVVAGPSDRTGPRVKMRVDVAGPPEAAQELLAELNEAMRRLNVYRGQTISLSPGQLGMGAQTLVSFHTLPAIDRTGIVLPNGLLERIERHTVTFSEHAATLLAAGRSLKRGLLLYGPPGTGKTLTVMYLVGRMPGRTVIVTTGRGMGLVEAIARMARQLAPSMVVLEDVDLIAEERGQPLMRTGPLLFELLSEMDGLRDDSDVIFVLTTNRPDILEPALAARPGRVDLAVELPLPDPEGRRRLFELYARGLPLAGPLDCSAFVERTEGVSPAFIKELLRKAALLAAEQGSETVGTEQMEAAMSELAEGGRLAERLLGFRPDSGSVEGRRPSRFPPGVWPPDLPQGA